MTRANVFQGVQVGVETVAGTAVTADVKLTGLNIEPKIGSEVNLFRPQGYKYPTVQAQGKEWAEASLSGQPTYTELVYLLSGLLGEAVITTPGGATLTRLWTFSPSTDAADVPVTFTVEKGDSSRAFRFPYGLLTALGLKSNRSQCELSGSMIGQAITDGITLTAGAAALELIPILPEHWDVYLADTQAGLAAAEKLAAAFTFDLQIGNKFGAVWTLNSSEASFAGHVDLVPTATLNLLVEADATGMGLLTQLRSGATKWVRLTATGPLIESGQYYSVQIDMACKVSAPQEFADQEGVFAVGWELALTHDETWGGAFVVAVKNELTALVEGS